MNIQLLFNTAELSWSHTLFSGIIGALIGGLVSGGITFFAMRVIDNQNKQRWEQDTFQKKKLDLILSTISLLADMLIYVNNTRKYIRIKDEPDLHTSFVKESERYKELYNHLSKLIKPIVDILSCMKKVFFQFCIINLISITINILNTDKKNLL